MTGLVLLVALLVGALLAWAHSVASEATRRLRDAATRHLDDDEQVTR